MRKILPVIPHPNVNQFRNYSKKASQPWFQRGLNFKCTGCGACCKWPGEVKIEERDIIQISRYLSLTPKEFIKEHVSYSVFSSAFVLKENENNVYCRFLSKDNRCEIYPVRPRQCITYPWWIDNISSVKNWNEEKKFCEGIDNSEATTVSSEIIIKELETSIDADKECENLTKEKIEELIPGVEYSYSYIFPKPRTK